MPSERAKSFSESGPLDFDILDDLLSFYVRVVNHAVSRDLDRTLRGLEVARGTGKVSTLILVDANPGIRPSTIAQLTLKDRAAIARMVDGFVEAGLMVKQVSATEQRAQALYLTEAGHKMAAKVRGIVTQQSDAFFHDITAEERRVLINLLGRVYRRVSGLAEDDAPQGTQFAGASRERA